MTRSFYFLIWISLAELAGCAHYAPLAVPTTAVGPGEEVVGVAEGRGQGIVEAIRSACLAYGADSMVNVFADTEWEWTPAGYRPSDMVRIRGTLIRYRDIHRKPAPPADADPKSKALSKEL